MRCKTLIKFALLRPRQSSVAFVLGFTHSISLRYISFVRCEARYQKLDLKKHCLIRAIQLGIIVPHSQWKPKEFTGTN